MSILIQNKLLSSSKHHFQRPCQSSELHTPAYFSDPLPDPNKLVTEPPQSSQLEPSPTILRDNIWPMPSDESLLSTWSHCAWVASGFITVLISLANSIIGAAHSQIWVKPILAGLVGYLLADLGSGLYHWAIDNYGSASTPIFGSHIEAFQLHHKYPWMVTKRQLANNLYIPARVMSFLVLPLVLTFDEPNLNGFIAVFFVCVMCSQQFHAWAHGSNKSLLPPLVATLQDFGILISRSQHSVHHKQPFNKSYCVSGIWNEFLDKHKVFEALEMIIFSKLGLKPRSWNEPTSEWTEEAETTSEVVNVNN